MRGLLIKLEWRSRMREQRRRIKALEAELREAVADRNSLRETVAKLCENEAFLRGKLTRQEKQIGWLSKMVEYYRPEKAAVSQ